MTNGDETNMMDTLYCDDCLRALESLPDASAQLIYLDPPFNTNTKRIAPNAQKQNGPRAEYADAFGSAQDYITFMRPRAFELRRVLSLNGSLFFHCDWRTSHHVRVMLDEIFNVARGETRLVINDPLSTLQNKGVFVNEIIWHYGLGAAKTRRQLLSKHDTIFWYANSDRYTFNLLRGEPTQAMLAKYRHVDEAGRRYMNSYGKKYEMKGGKPLDDVWNIPAIAPTSDERVGYPTQKPLALLDRIVRLASNEGDTVLDPFCGSGTTLVAAKQLNRKYIGIDANIQAIEIARSRLNE
jgi:site-specific DNA-methyltransferase (adenine-specific)